MLRGARLITCHKFIMPIHELVTHHARLNRKQVGTSYLFPAHGVIYCDNDRRRGRAAAGGCHGRAGGGLDGSVKGFSACSLRVAGHGPRPKSL
eukprot:742306-Hanusia_phi.AAC.1